MKTPFEIKLSLIPEQHLYRHFLTCMDYYLWEYRPTLKTDSKTIFSYINQLLEVIKEKQGQEKADKAYQIMMSKLENRGYY